MAWSSLSLLVLVTAVVVPACADMAFLNKACSQSQHNDVCLIMLLSDPGGINCMDLRCVASIGANVALAYSYNTTVYLKNSGQPPDQTAFSFCFNIYGTLDNRIKDSIDTMGRQDYAGAGNIISDVINDPDKCDAAFESHPNKMTTSNQRMGDLLDVIWEFLDQITS